MKALKMILCAAALAAAAWSAGAEEKAAPVQPKPSDSAGKAVKAVSQAPNKEKELNAATGSYLPQRTIVHRHITASASPLIIIDSGAIQQSGASDVGELLRRGGWAAVHR